MKYLSLCSGIEAASVAWEHLGWNPVAFAEIEPFPCAVLKERYPKIPNLGDIKNINGKHFYGAVDLIVGGTPCQDFSIAGRRAGLAGERSGLAREFIRLVHEINPQWIIWENVPGVFSTNNGRDFGAFLKALDDCGYNCAWRVLDAQFFGVPQRRRRVFLVGYFGDWRCAAKILFERESVCRHFTPSEKARQETSRNIAKSVGNGEREPVKKRALYFSQNHIEESRRTYIPRIVNQAISCKWAKGSSGPSGDEYHNLIVQPNRITGTLCGSGAGMARTSGQANELDLLVCANQTFVRRLTPIECERLQGFPDNWTQVQFKGKKATDCLRYKALGNSMAVPVMRWIGERISKLIK